MSEGRLRLTVKDPKQADWVLDSSDVLELHSEHSKVSKTL